MHIQCEVAQAQVTQLIYNEIHELLTNEIYQCRYVDDFQLTAVQHQAKRELETYKKSFPKIWQDVSEAIYCQEHDI